jgi:hypothetical protein
MQSHCRFTCCFCHSPFVFVIASIIAAISVVAIIAGLMIASNFVCPGLMLLVSDSQPVVWGS